MVSDVPLGAFLSGGVDSSTVVALMSKISEHKIKTFSIGFEDEKFNELEYAKIVSKRYNTEHYEFMVKPQSIDILPKLVDIYDEPFADSSAIPTYFLSKLTRDHVTVALSGDGGDELFAGYEKYYKMIKMNKRPLNNYLVNGLVSLIHKSSPDYLNLKKWTYYFGVDSNNIGAYLGYFKKYERDKLYNTDIIKSLQNYCSEELMVNILNRCNSDFISRMQYLDINTYLVDDILTKVDRASMANSLEVRVPLLDHNFVELICQIPSKNKIDNYNQKLIFKNAVSGLVPKKIIQAKKKGFGIPLSKWFKEDLKEYVNESLSSKNSKIFNFLDFESVKNLIEYNNKGYRDYSQKLWSLINLEEWLKQNF